MKKIVLVFILCFISSHFAFSQVLLWSSEYGGANSNGAVIGYDLNSDVVSPYVSLKGNPMYGFNLMLDTTFGDGSANFAGGLTLGQDGYYYGVNSFGGGIQAWYEIAGKAKSRGFFYRMDPQTKKIEVLYSFIGDQPWDANKKMPSDAYDGLSLPCYNVLEVSKGVFYGVAEQGGVSGDGGIWKYDTNKKEYKVIGSFNDSKKNIGYSPVTQLIKGDGDNIYGLNRQYHPGGSSGYLYKINTVTDELSYVGALNAAGWVMAHPHGQMVYVPSTNKIYGTKDRFDSSANWGGGVWSYNLSTGVQTNEWTILFPELSVLGNNLVGMVQGNDGKMYLTTKFGGAHGTGTIIQYSPSGNTYLKVFDFPSTFDVVSGTGMIVVGTKVFGTCSFSEDKAQLWSYDYINGSFKVLMSGTSHDQTHPGFNIEYGILNDNGRIVGRTRNGSNGGAGSFFKYDIALDQISVFKECASRDGRNIIGELTSLNDSMFVGFVCKGGPNAKGDPTLMDENGGLALFNVVSGSVEFLPRCFIRFNDDEFGQSFNLGNIFYDSNKTLYYIYTETHGFSVFTRFVSYDLDQKNAKLLKGFSPKYSSGMSNLLELPQNRLMFAYDNNVVVYNYMDKTFEEHKGLFDIVDNGVMDYHLTLASNGYVYGVTTGVHFGTKPDENRAMIYSIDPSNFTLNNEYRLDSVIRSTNGYLTEVAGKLYGSSNFSGDNGQGFLFTYDINDQTFEIKYSFDKASDGGGFSAGWTEYNGKLYSTSRTGGQHGMGTLVSYDYKNSTFEVVKHLTLQEGRSFRGTPVVWDNSWLTSVSDIHSISKDVSIYPNPAKTYFYVRSENCKNMKVEIFSLLGAKIKEVKNNTMINIEGLPVGAYIVKITHDKQVDLCKLNKVIQ
ncbi:MAG: T9SS type A sorting domain-containing protein [Prolixibacteraceae bacterium]|jgi:hypothetical protein|nr:T9SS type A sorting domain-containing protein [Prolixibacteraceae bacterium]